LAFDGMIHKAKVPLIAGAGKWKSHRHPDGSFLSLRQPGKLDSEQPDQVTREPPLLLLCFVCARRNRKLQHGPVDVL
jgi:hypothetical protein